MSIKSQRSSTLTLLVPLLTLLVSACSVAWNGTTYDPPRPAPNFSVNSSEGDSFTLTDQRGSIVLLYFGYTFCPDVCPATVAIMAQVFDQLNASPEELQFVMISVDPERETPEAVDAYMRRFHPDFIGLWVQRDQLDKILEDYGILAIKEPSDNPETYLITHTARVFVIDRNGDLRLHYPFGSVPADFVADLARLLKE